MKGNGRKGKYDLDSCYLNPLLNCQTECFKLFLAMRKKHSKFEDIDNT